MTAYDQIAINGILESGAVASVHYRGGMLKGTNFLWEINGSEGDIIITADGGSPGVFPLTIKGSNDREKPMEVLPLPKKYLLKNLENLSIPAANVATNYARVAQDINDGTHLSATFDDAVIRQRMIQAIEISAATGTRQKYTF